jgi:hypothetical protein
MTIEGIFEDTVCIYALTDPQSGMVKYIGMSKQPEVRIRAHWQEAKSGRRALPVHQWIKRLNRKPGIKILDTCLRSEGPDRERYWIRKFPQALNIVGADVVPIKLLVPSLS